MFSGAILHPLNKDNSTVNQENEVPLDKVYPALIQSFGIIFLGYLAAKFNVLTAIEAKGIGTFIGTFCLPALIFGSLCKLNLMSVNWGFITALFIAKATIFFAVLIVTYFIGRRPGRAGLFAIFSTQSNDFALGNPILQAIYSLSHPDFQSYLYLLAPISLVILNPIGFVFMEIGKQQEQAAGTNLNNSKWVLVKSVIKGICTNAVIVMTFLGIIGNFAFSGHLPEVIDGFLNSLGDAFSASALFLLGVNMVCNNCNKNQGNTWITPLILIIAKSIAMPIIAREVVNLLNVGANATDTQEWSNFGFLYGTFPSAPGVFVYASKYDLETDMIASGMVACTFISAPIMFISARLLSVKSINPSEYINELDTFLLDISIVSLIACLWVMFVFINSKKWNQMPHLVTMGLAFAQVCGCIGAILWSTMDCIHGWKLYLQFIFFAYGVYASRINTALIAVTLILSKRKSRCYVMKLRPYMIFIGFFTPGVLVLIMLMVVKDETPKHGDKVDPNFQYGVTQACFSLVLLLLSFFTTIITLIVSQRSTRPEERENSSEDDPSRHLLSSQDGANSNGVTAAPMDRVEDVEDILIASTAASDNAGCSSNCRARSGAGRYRCDSEQRDYNSSLLDSYAVPPANEAIDLQSTDEFDFFKHTILLVFLSVSMFVGIALCIWTLVMERMTGIYVELVFLDGFLNFGQGLFTFAIFGLDAKYVLMPLQKWLRRKWYGQESLVLLDWEDLDEETKRQCQQFLKHHISNCMETLVRDVRHGLITYKAVFRGKDLIDWINEADLVSNRQDGVNYCRNLIKGRVLRHVDNYLDFYDDNFLYTFARNR